MAFRDLIFNGLNNLFPARPKHIHDWTQFSKIYKINKLHCENKERCSTCYRIRIVKDKHIQIERFTSNEAIMDDILGFMRYAFKI